MVFYYRGVEEMDASSAAMHQFLVPVLATGFAAYFLNERLDPVQGIGLIVLITGLYLVFKRQVELPLKFNK
jgi:drug/metabolite transporter (DMT)-like permease